MYKIIVVEDDRIIRRGICQAIPWEKNDILVAGEASDGEMALALIEEHQPHVVISDIHMPFLNGLDMLRKVKEISPNTEIIFLTGYEDFTYAQQAVQLKAFDYLLKPVDSTLLLDKVKEALTVWEKKHAVEKQLTKSRPILQQKFFKKLMELGVNEVDVEKGLADLNVHLDGAHYTTIIIHYKYESEEQQENFKTIIENYVLNKMQREKFTILSVAENEWALLLGHEESEMILQLAKYLLDQLKKHTDVTLSYGRSYVNLFEIGRSFIEAKMAMDLRYVMGTGILFSIDDKVTNNLQAGIELRTVDTKLMSQIKQGIPEKVLPLFDQFIELIFQYKSLSLEDLKVITLKYATLLLFEIERWSKEESSIDSGKLYQSVMQMNAIEDMIQLFNELIEKWAELLYEKEESDYKSHVDLAIQYMNDNFSDSTLTLQKVAKLIHVSTPYLSNLFKIEKGFNFGQYLLELRMKKAMELLREDKLKTYEVSEQVGYSNPQYFSICFKKYTGYTPAEFKKKINHI